MADWNCNPPDVCDYLCSHVCTVRKACGSWLVNLDISCPLKGEGCCQGHKSIQMPLLPLSPMHALPMDKEFHFSTGPHYWLGNGECCSESFYLDFLMGFSGGIYSQVPVPASPCSQKGSCIDPRCDSVTCDGPWLVGGCHSHQAPSSQMCGSAPC